MRTIWLLRAGLGLEIFGGFLLSFDVLNKSIRTRISEAVQRGIEETKKPLFLFSIVIVVSILLSSGETDSFLYLTYYTGILSEYKIFELWMDILQKYGIPINSIVFYLAFIILCTIPSVAHRYYRISPVDSKRIRLILAVLMGVSVVLFMIFLPYVLASLIISIVFWFIISSAILLTLGPIWAGQLLENSEIVASGVRFIGLVFLLVGFLIQFAWSFIS